MAYDFVDLKIANHVGWLEFHHPPVNAFNQAMTQSVSAALEQFSRDANVRVIVLASALEGYFSVGAELEWFRGISASEMGGVVDTVHGIAGQLRASDKPLLAAIHGTAVGAGLEMSYHCDIRFAAQDARFGQPEININFIPPAATTQSLVRLLGRPRAIRFLYEGALVGADEALQMGLVDILTPAEALRKEVQAYGEALAGKPPEALAAIRRTITGGMDLPFDEALKIEKAAALRLIETRNFSEGIEAFLAKRPPNWQWPE